MIPSLVALIQEAGLSEDAKRQAAHALAMLAAEDSSYTACLPFCNRGFCDSETRNLLICARMDHVMQSGRQKLVLL